MKKNILLTNDDGINSPLFELLYRVLEHKANIFVVAPAKEKSWQGKSMTRFGKIFKEKKDFFDIQAIVLDGTPADCANYGIFNLEVEIDLVISGINFGCNAGLGYAWSSGTLGACIEANIVGKKALAVSQHLSIEDYDLWAKEGRLRSELYDEYLPKYKIIFEQILSLYENKLSSKGICTWSFNFPEHIPEHVNFVPTRLGKTLYGRYFKDLDEKTITYDLQHYRCIDTSVQSDTEILWGGAIPVTKINPFLLGQEIDWEF